MNAKRIWSLLSLIRAKAELYIHIGRIFQFWMNQIDSALSEPDQEAYREALTILQRECGKLDLPVSSTLVKDALQEAVEFKADVSAASKMAELHRCVEAELKSSVYFLVPTQRARYLAFFSDIERTELTGLGEELQRFTPIIVAFPSTIYDIEQAGSCFAFGVFTACVFHLMRVCEYGLVSLAESLKADPGISSWEKLLRKIRDKITENQNSKPHGWREEEEFYSEAATLITNVKNSWRNPVSHIRGSYDEQRARRIFHGVEALMFHLATRLKEKPIPQESVLNDPDANPALALEPSTQM